VQPFQRLWFDLALGGVAGAWALLLLVGDRGGPLARRVWSIVELAAFSVGVAALGLELGLRAWAASNPSALTARVGAGPRELVKRFRCQPGEVRFGFPCNSRGFYDEEFMRRDADDATPLVASIGDSFSVGMVPHPLHFTTICETQLDARIDNIGVAGVGPAEYLTLLVEEALPLAPDMILVGVFVGNDLNVYDALVDLPNPRLRAWLQRDHVLLYVLPKRLIRLRSERARLRALRGGAPRSQEAADQRLVLTPEQALAAYPWVSDPSLEESSLSPEAFHRLETERARDICSQEPPSLQLLQKSLRAAKRAAGRVPLAVMLIPDEFQVEDSLWSIVEARAARPLERTRAQALVKAWLAQEGIPCLDLLPVLRTVPPLQDGDRHLYHRLDTHFNARGNEAVAKALVEFLREDIEAIRARREGAR
jgi:hypothetical protein